MVGRVTSGKGLRGGWWWRGRGRKERVRAMVRGWAGAGRGWRWAVGVKGRWKGAHAARTARGKVHIKGCKRKGTRKGERKTC